jgi:hypothetical protein
LLSPASGQRLPNADGITSGQQPSPSLIQKYVPLRIKPLCNLAHLTRRFATGKRDAVYAIGCAPVGDHAAFGGKQVASTVQNSSLVSPRTLRVKECQIANALIE